MLHVTKLLIFLSLVLGGCVNKRGISGTYYNSCKEFYDLQGYYHKECDENIIDFSISDTPETDPNQKVW